MLINDKIKVATIGWLLFILAGVLTKNEAWFPVGVALIWVAVIANAKGYE